MDYKISVLKGDGIGHELVQSAVDILGAVSARYGHAFKYFYPLIGGAALDATGVSLPQDTIDICAKTDASIVGCIGGGKYTNEYGLDKAQRALVNLCNSLGLYISVTPISFTPLLSSLSPLKSKVLKSNHNIFLIKESIGGLFRGSKGFKSNSKLGEQAYDTDIISISEIERIARSAFDLAALKQIPLASVDMADKTESGKLWRKIVAKMALAYPTVKTKHYLVDECIYKIGRDITDFGVILTSELLGQIIVAQLASLTGCIQNIATANIGKDNGVYLSHRQNPNTKPADINPIGTILAVALMLSQSCKLSTEATAIETAVKTTLSHYQPHSLGGTLSHTKFTEYVALQIINDK